jgi:hypothetical protein
VEDMDPVVGEDEVVDAVADFGGKAEERRCLLVCLPAGCRGKQLDRDMEGYSRGEQDVQLGLGRR